VWELITVNGRTLPTPAPEEPNVTLHSIVVTLERGGSYSLASESRLSGQAEGQNATIGGSWDADNTTLTFESREGPAIVQFGYTHDDDLMSMTDEHGNVWMMRRRD
jgi:hypothetical protein